MLAKNHGRKDNICLFKLMLIDVLLDVFEVCEFNIFFFRIIASNVALQGPRHVVVLIFAQLTR